MLMGGVAYYVIRQPSPIPPLAVSSTSSSVATTTTVAATDENIEVAIPVPGGRSDRRFRVALADGKAVEQMVEKGWRISGSMFSEPLLDSSEDVTRLTGGEWNVVLRAKDGTPYREPVLVGALDRSHVLVAALHPGPVLLRVSVSGELFEAYKPPEASRYLGTSQGLTWYSTFMPGEGLESEPQGPSELLRVTSDGQAQTVAKDERVIISAVSGPQGAFAYFTDKGEGVARSGTDAWRGEMRPLVWLDDHRLLLARGTELLLLNLTSAEMRRITDLPAVPTTGWMDTKAVGL